MFVYDSDGLTVGFRGWGLQGFRVLREGKKGFRV